MYIDPQDSLDPVLGAGLLFDDLLPPAAKQAVQARALRRSAPGAAPMPQPSPAVPGAPAPAPAAAGALPGRAARIDDLYGRAGELRGQAYGSLEPSPEELAQAQLGAANQGWAGTVLSSMGGKQFRPAGAQILQQALARENRFAPDPFRQGEIKAKRLEAEAAALEKRAAAAETFEEREALRAAADQTRRDIAQMQIDSRESMRAMTAGIAGANRADRQTEREEAAAQKRTDTVRREYNTRLDKVRAGAGFANSVVQQLADPNIAKSAPAQVALVMQFGKMLDPDSVVREAEQRMIAEARGWLESLQMTPERIMAGVRLSPAQLAKMRDIALMYQRTSGAQVDTLNDFYAGLATRNKLPVEDIVQGYKPKGAENAHPSTVPRFEPRRATDTAPAPAKGGAQQLSW